MPPKRATNTSPEIKGRLPSLSLTMLLLNS
uniref:Uncharacterized protein n=1 Tax=Arundo donax TaxID=35708 RepID=A0A0A9ELB1_ARUDO